MWFPSAFPSPPRSSLRARRFLWARRLSCTLPFNTKLTHWVSQATARVAEGKERGDGQQALWSGKRGGDRPNVYWRAVSMEHLRQHPLFDAAPEPRDVSVRGPEDFWRFRQDSVEWGLLHHGRVTTSRMASVLGFYEPLAARILGVPRSLAGSRKAVEAYWKLSLPPVTLAALAAATPRPSTSIDQTLKPADVGASAGADDGSRQRRRRRAKGKPAIVDEGTENDTPASEKDRVEDTNASRAPCKLWSKAARGDAPLMGRILSR